MTVSLRYKGHTCVFRNEAGQTQVVYHNTVIVAFNFRRIVLNSGGWRTATTKQRMNQASREFGLGFSVYQRDFNWYVTGELVSDPLGGKDDRPFYDGIELLRPGR